MKDQSDSNTAASAPLEQEKPTRLQYQTPYLVIFELSEHVLGGMDSFQESDNAGLNNPS